MKNFLGFILLIIIFLSINAQAEDKTKSTENVPAGMEIIQVGNGQQLILPQGTKMRRVGAQLILEDNAGYVAQKLIAIEERLTKLELAQTELQLAVQELKASPQK